MKAVFHEQMLGTLLPWAEEQEEVCAALDIARYGYISKYLHKLELADFIAKNYTWSIKTGADS